MNKLPIFILLVLLGAMAMPSCNSDDDNNWTSTYQEWHDKNEAWLIEQQGRKNPDGTPYYETVVPQWNPSSYVLVHYYNDRRLTNGNLQPMYTSTVDTRYIGYYYNGTPLDSSYNVTTYGPGIFRTQLSGVIEGWAIALETMHVGDSVEMVIPYQSAYGVSYTSSVPPYSNLRFQMKLVDVYRYETNPK